MSDFILGKKVEPPKPVEPEWKAVEGKKYLYVNAKGQKRYAPPVPDTPMHPTPWDAWRDYMKQHGILPEQPNG